MLRIWDVTKTRNGEWGMGNGKLKNGKIKKKSKNWKKTRNSYTLQINKNMKAEYNVFEAKIIQSVFSKRNYYLIN